jgi:serine/threonine protein phosphatase PrpC
MQTTFDIAGFSQPYRGKNKCGDALAYRLLPSGYLVFAIADGVSSQPCDWLASQLACNKFVEIVEKSLVNNGVMNWTLWLNEVNQHLRHADALCQGMLTTFVGAVWHTESNVVDFVNIGDSRLYKLTAEKDFLQLTTDEVKALNLRNKQGKLILQSGYTVTQLGLTNALGLETVEIKPQNTTFKVGETLFLVTDGFYNCTSSFEQDCRELAQLSILQPKIDKLKKIYYDQQQDDATLLIVRNNGKQPTDFVINSQTYLKLATEFSTTQLVVQLISQIEKALQHDEVAEVMSYLTLIEQENLQPTKEQLENLLVIFQQYQPNHVQIFQKIVGLLRKIMKG